MLRGMRHDLRAVLERDPAARTRLEILLCYPGVWAVWSHRLAHRLWCLHLKLLARWLSQVTRTVTGIEIHPGARIGPGLFIDHGMGVVIGETAEIGADVTLYHGVTLGGTSLERGKRHPTIGDRVVVGAGAKVLGPIEVGEGSRIGANAVVVRSVPGDVVVVGVPGEVVARRHLLPPHHAPDLEHGELPDVLGETLLDLLARVADLERQLECTADEVPFTSEGGVWREQDD
jgi:serine O-acetyltransferase